MKSIKQMLRQPLKTITGIILMTLAVAVLCVCVGQSFAAKTTEKSLNDRFTTIAIPAGLQRVEDLVIKPSVTLPEDLRLWLEETATEYPDIVKGIIKQGILSAYIPELTPLNYTQGKYISDEFTSGNFAFHFFEPDPYGTPYSCAMFVISLEEVSEPTANTKTYTLENELQESDFSSYAEYQEYLENLKEEIVTVGYTIKLSGTITKVVSLQEGFRDPTGMIARLSMTVPTLDQLKKLNLIPGQQYLVYGTDYYDEDWAFRSLLAHEDSQNPIVIDSFDMSQLHILTEEELKDHSSYPSYNMPFARYGSLLLTKTEYERVNAISMTLSIPISLLQYEEIRDESGDLLELRENTTINYTDLNGEKMTIDCDDYIHRYTIPTITQLNGSVEAFLKTDDGALWNAARERDNINNSAFAVIGVDRLGYMADFARQNAQIVAGRDFTENETSNGARVCVIHESLAVANGLKIGDTITTNFYQTDFALPYQSNKNQKRNLLNPSASLYFDTTPFTETAEYTIVGFYRTDVLWCDVSENEYGFSPNTIFVPKTSVETDMEYGDSVLFTTPVIHNGQLDAFRELISKAGYSERFVYHDQGYSMIAQNFHNYADLAGQVLVVGVAVYAVILFLFLLMYPYSQRKVVTTMESLGVPIKKRFAHVVLSAIVIAAPATLLGGTLGIILWQSAVSALKASAETTVSLQIEVSTLLLIALAQFVLTMLLSAIASAFVVAPKDLSARRTK